MGLLSSIASMAPAIAVQTAKLSLRGYISLNIIACDIYQI
jgi:hypothetical protein